MTLARHIASRMEHAYPEFFKELAFNAPKTLDDLDDCELTRKCRSVLRESELEHEVFEFSAVIR